MVQTRASAFPPGTLILATLNSPREKFWGVLLDLSVAGITMRGIELSSFDDTAAMVRNSDPVSATTVFFPLMRVERIELDIENGEIPSLGHRFNSKAGMSPLKFLRVAEIFDESGRSE